MLIMEEGVVTFDRSYM